MGDVVAAKVDADASIHDGYYCYSNVIFYST